MMPAINHLLLWCTLCLAVSLAAFVQPQYDIYGNVKQTEYHKYNPDCCIVPSCDEYRRCVDTIRCDHICSSGNYKKANYGSTPGYRLKESYTKYDCRFGECHTFKFTCYHCPDPTKIYFNIRTVRNDCLDCYERLY